MAKKKKGKVIPMLSPENYIKQKARSLPVYECWINDDWEDSKLTQLIVARNHSTGNITFGIYLVDLNCLGVKDAFYLFNVPQYAYREHLEATNENMAINLKKISYTLAHNIVYAGLEFAENYGFKPHKDFSVAKYILEEDTDDIELIEVECGVDDMPFYMRGPYEDDHEANKIIAQLEKTAGPGNYKFVDAPGFEFDEDHDEFDDKFDVYDDPDDQDPASAELAERIDDMHLDDKIAMLKELLSGKIEPEETDSMIVLMLIQSISFEYSDRTLVTKYLAKIEGEIKKYKITDDLSDELLGMNEQNQFGLDRELWQNQFLEILYSPVDEKKHAREKLKKIKKTMPDNPAVHFLELNLMNRKSPEIHKEKLESCFKQFPDYPLFKIMNMTFENDQDYQSVILEGPKVFFGQRKELDDVEIYYYLMKLNFIALIKQDFSLIEAIGELLYKTKLNKDTAELLIGQNFESKMNMIEFKQNENESESFAIEYSEAESTVFQFKIQIKGIKQPPVWRRLLVPASMTFYEFHLVLQSAFGWRNSHLFEFSPRGLGSYPSITTNYGEELEQYGETIEAEDIFLYEIFKKETQRFIYVYDFGDDWEHQITLEKIIPDSKPIIDCIAGKGKCPPEDCGGVGGFANMKEVMKDKDDPEYFEFIEWLGLEEGEEWDPLAFDLEKVKLQMKERLGR